MSACLVETLGRRGICFAYAALQIGVSRPLHIAAIFAAGLVNLPSDAWLRLAVAREAGVATML